jgi:hypothetical protein
MSVIFKLARKANGFTDFLNLNCLKTRIYLPTSCYLHAKKCAPSIMLPIRLSEIKAHWCIISLFVATRGLEPLYEASETSILPLNYVA